MRSFIMIEVRHNSPADLHDFLKYLDHEVAIDFPISVIGTRVKGPLREAEIMQNGYVLPAESLDTVTIYEP